MIELNLDKFHPQKAELTILANSYKQLQINGVDDKEGYQAVDAARKDLKKVRVELTKTGKALRADALAFQKQVIATEKELVELIEPVEIELEQKQKVIDDLAIMERRRALLPMRLTRLTEVGAVVDEVELLEMSDEVFDAFILQKKEENLAKEKADLEAAQAKLAQEKAKLEEQARIDEARRQAEEKARINAQIDAKLAAEKAERDKQAAIEAERLKAENEKRVLIAEQERKENERVAAIEAEKKAKADQERLALEEQAKLEKKKKYQAFLAEHGYTKETASQFNTITDQELGLVKLYRLVGEFKF